ncbi:hypothetical protein N7488_003055 [Penicillium malachiteum]|nr:hypothetical protein N7488_003055 [Penicillium malachiteum]
MQTLPAYVGLCHLHPTFILSYYLALKEELPDLADLWWLPIRQWRFSFDCQQHPLKSLEKELAQALAAIKAATETRAKLCSSFRQRQAELGETLAVLVDPTIQNLGIMAERF